MMNGENMKRAYLAIKFHEDFSNRDSIESILDILQEKGIECVVMAKDFEKYGEIKFTPDELMKLAFEQIDKSDFLVIEFSEKGVGLGIEAGYAYSRGIPIIVIAKEGSKVSNTLRGITRKIVFYESFEELKENLRIS